MIKLKGFFLFLRTWGECGTVYLPVCMTDISWCNWLSGLGQILAFMISNSLWWIDSVWGLSHRLRMWWPELCTSSLLGNPVRATKASELQCKDLNLQYSHCLFQFLESKYSRINTLVKKIFILEIEAKWEKNLERSEKKKVITKH